MRRRSSTSATRRTAWPGSASPTPPSGALTDQTRAARDAGLQGANDGALGQTARDALAANVEQLRSALISTANTTYLGRPVLGGVTSGSVAYAESGAFVGAAGAVFRTVADGIDVRVDTDGTAVLGPDGDSVLDHLAALAGALRSGDTATVRSTTQQITADLDRIAAAHAEVGTRYQRLDAAQQTALDDTLRLKATLSDVEDADLPATVVDLQLAQTSYQAALSATSRVLQPSLLDFLR